MSGQAVTSQGFDRGLICLQFLGWIVVALVTLGPALDAPLLIAAPPAGVGLDPEKQSGRGKSRYARLAIALDASTGADRPLRAQISQI